MTDDNSLYNADELIAPDWLNANFFEEILTKKQAGCIIKVTSVTITPGTTKSDHYGSVMFRAKITYNVLSHGIEKVQSQSLIVKTTPTLDGQKKELLGNYSLFATEIKMYSETLPKIESILRKHGDNTKLYADIFYFSSEPRECLIFEDLVELGYTTISQRHCNIEEVKAALLKLAKLHAVSYKLEQEGDTSIPSYNEGSFSHEKVLDFKFVKEGLTIFKDNLKKHDDLQFFVPHLESIEGNIFPRIFNSFNAYKNGKRNGIFVLNHGDFHMKNMMIRNAGAKLEDLMLLDFQISVFASPAIDLMYAYIMLFSPEMRLRNRDELFYSYFSNFQETLKQVEFKGRIPTMIDFQKELLDHAHWELYLACTFLLTNYLLPDPTADLTKFIEDETYRNKLWEREDVMKGIRALFPAYLYKGYFENIE